MGRRRDGTTPRAAVRRSARAVAISLTVLSLVAGGCGKEKDKNPQAPPEQQDS